MPSDPAVLDAFIQEASSSAKYAQIAPILVSRIAREEFNRHKSKKDALRAARARLHQLVTAYLQPGVSFARLNDSISALQPTNEQQLKEDLRALMRLHSSTNERLPILDDFYRTSLAGVPPLRSVLDLGCGLNPLSYTWLPSTDNCLYFAADVVLPMIDSLNHFFSVMGMQGEALVLDLSGDFNFNKSDLTMLLKILPLLDQIDKGLAPYLIDHIKSDYLLISYPLKSLGGRGKGMLQTYRAHFLALMERKPWQYREVVFSNELVYICSRESQIG
ncbi:MAG: hypothetical protein ACOYKD_03940 [Anaerolineaceae bacterium]|jgi:16S rRNA (guanine(1405)-N(7))-methyltransferase